MSNRIKRITLFPVRVSIANDRVNSPAFAHETLNRKATGEWGGEWFGGVPFYVFQVEGDGGPAGIGDSPRVVSGDVLRQLAPHLIGLAASDITATQSVVERHWSAVKTPDGPYNKSSYDFRYYKGLDTALLDWAARQQDRPFSDHFGPRVRQRVRCEFWNGFHTPDGVKAVVAKAMSLGFLGLKLKANLDIDVPGVVQAVLDTAGPNFNLNIDANGRWMTFENSLARIAPAMKINPNVLFEDPVYGNYPALAALRKQTGCRTATHAGSVESVQRAHRLEAIDVFNCVGLWNVIPQVADAIDAVGKPYWLGSALESSIGDTASLQFASTRANCTAGSDLVSAFFREDDLIINPIRYEAGHALVPEGPGLGIELDLNAVEKYRAGDPIVIE